MSGRFGRHAGRAWMAVGEGAGPGLDQQRVGVAVVAALELDDQAAPGEAAREANRRHRRLGARRNETDLIERGHEPAQRLGELDLGFRRRAEGKRARSGLLDRFDHGGVRVAGHHRAPGPDIVDVTAAIRVPQVGTRGALEEQRHAADRTKGAYRRVDAARDDALRTLEQRFAFHVNSFPYWRARRLTSGASKRSEMTASRSAPALMSRGAFSSVIPPIAASGTPSFLALVNRECGARTAPEIGGDANTLPKAT